MAFNQVNKIELAACEKPAAWVCLYDGRMTWMRHFRCAEHRPESYEFAAVMPLLSPETFEP